jgi:hypothetical protein
VNWQLTRVSGRSGWKSDIGGRSVCPNNIYNVDIVYGCRPCVRSSTFPTAKSRHWPTCASGSDSRVRRSFRKMIAEFFERHTVKSMDSAYGLWGAGRVRVLTAWPTRRRPARSGEGASGHLTSLSIPCAACPRLAAYRAGLSADTLGRHSITGPGSDCRNARSKTNLLPVH